MPPTYDFSSFSKYNFGDPSQQAFSVPNLQLGAAAPNLDFSSIAGYGQPAVSLPNMTIPNENPAYPQLGSRNAPTPTTMPKLGWNLPSFQIGLGAAQTGANIYSAIEAASLAKQQLAYAKEMGNANLANQMKSYNTSLTGQANMDAKVGGWNPQQTADYINANKLTGK